MNAKETEEKTGPIKKKLLQTERKKERMQKKVETQIQADFELHLNCLPLALVHQLRCIIIEFVRLHW